MQRWHESAFTLVELIVVILVIGILSSVAATRFSNSRGNDASSYAEQVRSVYRFGQKLAIAQNRPVFVSTTATRVALCFDAACSQRVPAPTGNSGREETTNACGDKVWFCEGVPNGISIVAGPHASMFFSGQGRPYASNDSLASDSSSFGTLIVTISGGDAPQTLTVEQETGYVH